MSLIYVLVTNPFDGDCSDSEYVTVRNCVLYYFVGEATPFTVCCIVTAPFQVMEMFDR